MTALGLLLGLRMDDSTVRVAVGLRLGTRMCGAHTCQHCEADLADTPSVIRTAWGGSRGIQR